MSKTCPLCGTAYNDADIFCPLDASTLRPSVESDDLIGTVIADRYFVMSRIGEGGMGRVYLGRHVRLPQQVAIKVLHPVLVFDPTTVERFHREAMNASQIENEHVARVIDHGSLDDGRLYLVMEYVEGESLSALIAREGPLPPDRVAEITLQIADALAAAHELPNPIVHRDLKPDNIIVGKQRNGRDKVKVVDFGIAEAVHGGGKRLTEKGLVIGTPAYISPEQVSEFSFDARSDIYSLAIVVFNMLTGELPFAGETAEELALVRLRNRPRLLSETKPGVDWALGLQAVLDRGLARQPADRHATAPAFARALTDVLHAPAPPSPALPLTQPGGLPKPADRVNKRRWLVAALFGASTLVGVASIVLYTGRPRDAAAPVRKDTPQPHESTQKDANTKSDPLRAGLPNGNNGQGQVTAQGHENNGGRVREPAKPPPIVASGVSLDGVSLMIDRAAKSDSAEGARLARGVLDSVPSLLKRLKTRQDTVELGVNVVAAWLLVGNGLEACRMLETIETEATQMPSFKARVEFWNRELRCR